MPSSWGKTARRGARRVEPDDLPDWWDQEQERAAKRDRPTPQEEWLRDPSPGDAQQSGSGPIRYELPEDELDLGSAQREFRSAVGEVRGDRLVGQLRSAADSYANQRFDEARIALTKILKLAPESLTAKELYGLSLYRLDRFAEAIDELEWFRMRTAGTEQNHVLADCYRALGRYDEVEERWNELRREPPSKEAVASGRLVMAGTLAEQGRLDDAIALLGKGWSFPKNPDLHHCDRAYVLGDLHERAGDLPTARRWFGRVARADPGFADVSTRVADLA